MLAVSAVLRHQGYNRPLFVATTRYVVEDKSAHVKEIAQELGVEVYSAPLDFSHSSFPGLSDYERGFVKEGVGAGGAAVSYTHLDVYKRQVVVCVLLPVQVKKFISI